jgi:hypothetical protein
MSVVLRALGLQAAYAVLQTFSPAAARAASLVLLLGANAMPLLALLSGRWGAGDVLIVYWLENVAVGLWAAVRVGTASLDLPVAGTSHPATGARPADQWSRAFGEVVRQSGDPRAAAAVGLFARFALLGFFCLHFGGFTLVHGIFTFSLAGQAGTTGSFGGYLMLLLALITSHGLSTAIHWFARGERTCVGPQRVMGQVYPRVVVMHLAVLGAGWLLVGSGPLDLSAVWGDAARLAPGLLLIGIKVVADVMGHVREHAPDLSSRTTAPAGQAASGPAA